MPTRRPRGCVAPRRIQSTRSCVGGQTGRPSPQRFASIRWFARENASSMLALCTLIVGAWAAPSPPKAERQRVNPS